MIFASKIVNMLLYNQNGHELTKTTDLYSNSSYSSNKYIFFCCICSDAHCNLASLFRILEQKNENNLSSGVPHQISHLHELVAVCKVVCTNNLRMSDL